MKAKEFIVKHSDWVKVIIHDGDLEELEEFMERYVNEIDRLTKKEAQEYAEFCITCERKGIPLLEIDGYLQLKR